MVEADKEKLSRLLDYWIEHNKEHGDEFREWAEKARSFTGAAIRDHLLGARWMKSMSFCSWLWIDWKKTGIEGRETLPVEVPK